MELLLSEIQPFGDFEEFFDLPAHAVEFEDFVAGGDVLGKVREKDEAVVVVVPFLVDSSDADGLHAVVSRLFRRVEQNVSVAPTVHDEALDFLENPVGGLMYPLILSII